MGGGRDATFLCLNHYVFFIYWTSVSDFTGNKFQSASVCLSLSIYYLSLYQEYKLSLAFSLQPHFLPLSAAFWVLGRPL